MVEGNEWIPVTEEVWRELGHVKQDGQTWDELLGELATERIEARLRHDMNEMRERSEFIPLDEAGKQHGRTV